MTLEELIDLLDDAELLYYSDTPTEFRRRNEFFAHYVIDALAQRAAVPAEPVEEAA